MSIVNRDTAYEKTDCKCASANRNRIRARIGFRADITDEVFFDMRLGSGSADPASTNQTLGSAWSSKPVWIDRAYLAYLPKGLPGFGIGIGKEETPFHKAGMNQLIWDDDLNPEGIYAEYNGKITQTTSFTTSPRLQVDIKAKFK